MAKIVTVTQYEAVDGSVFLTESECDAHEFMLENGVKINAAADAFLNTTKAIDRSRNMQLNVIKNFLAFYLPWVEAGEPVVERTVFDTVKEEKAATDEEKAAVAEEVAQNEVSSGAALF